MSRLNYLWRLLMTGVAFASFSLGGLLITLLAFPLIRALPGGPDKRRARSQRFIHHMFRLFVGFMCVSGIMRLRVQGAEALRGAQGVLVLANHPTLIDVVVMIALMPRADCVVKAALWDSPFLGGVVRAAGYINNDKTPEELVSACAQAITAGGALIIFPEGTRSVPGQALRFQRGAAHIALESRAPILPVVLTCTPATLMKGQPWYRIPPRRFEVGLEVKSALAVGDLVDLNLPPTLGTRRLTEALEHYFTQGLANHAGHAGSDQTPDHRGA